MNYPPDPNLVRVIPGIYVYKRFIIVRSDNKHRKGWWWTIYKNDRNNRVRINLGRCKSLADAYEWLQRKG